MSNEAERILNEPSEREKALKRSIYEESEELTRSHLKQIRNDPINEVVFNALHRKQEFKYKIKGKVIVEDGVQRKTKEYREIERKPVRCWWL